MPKYSAVFYHAPGATVDTVALEGSKTACTKAARDIAQERGWRFVELMAAAQHGVQADVAHAQQSGVNAEDNHSVESPRG